PEGRLGRVISSRRNTAATSTCHAASPVYRQKPFDTCYVRTYYVRMNLTLSVDEQTVERAREVARQQGTSLNAVVREFLEQFASQATGDELLKEFENMWAEIDRSSTGSSPRYRFDRDEIYAERLDRYKGRRG